MPALAQADDGLLRAAANYLHDAGEFIALDRGAAATMLRRFFFGNPDTVAHLPSQGSNTSAQQNYLWAISPTWSSSRPFASLYLSNKSR